MKIALYILAGTIGLTGCAAVRHQDVDRNSRSAVKTLPPDLARELGKNNQNVDYGGRDIAFVVVIDRYNRISLLRASNNKPQGIESADTKSQSYPSVTNSPYLMHPNSRVKILTPEAEKEFARIGLNDIKQVFLTNIEPQHLMAGDFCQPCPPRQVIPDPFGGIGVCAEPVTRCGVDDEEEEAVFWWLWH